MSSIFTSSKILLKIKKWWKHILSIQQQNHKQFESNLKVILFKENYVLPLL